MILKDEREICSAASWAEIWGKQRDCNGSVLLDIQVMPVEEMQMQ